MSSVITQTGNAVQMAAAGRSDRLSLRAACLLIAAMSGAFWGGIAWLLW